VPLSENMKWIKKILFPLFSLFLLQQSIEIMKQVIASAPGDFTTREILFVAFLLALYITGIFAFTGFAYPTNRILPAVYYKIKNPKRLKQVYQLLGVKYFRMFLLVFFWGNKKNARKYFNGTRSGLKNFIYQANQSEFGHFAAFVTITILSIALLIQSYLLLFIVLSALNVIANLYPVILQRYHRIRIGKLAETGNL
jgi:hypothetical protein